MISRIKCNITFPTGPPNDGLVEALFEYILTLPNSKEFQEKKVDEQIKNDQPLEQTLI